MAEDEREEQLNRLLSGEYVLVKTELIDKSRKANLLNLVAILLVAALSVGFMFALNAHTQTELSRSQRQLAATQASLTEFTKDSGCRSVATAAEDQAFKEFVEVVATRPVDPAAYSSALAKWSTALATRAKVAAEGCG